MQHMKSTNKSYSEICKMVQNERVYLRSFTESSEMWVFTQCKQNFRLVVICENFFSAVQAAVLKFCYNFNLRTNIIYIKKNYCADFFFKLVSLMSGLLHFAMNAFTFKCKKL